MQSIVRMQSIISQSVDFVFLKMYLIHSLSAAYLCSVMQGLESISSAHWARGGLQVASLFIFRVILSLFGCFCLPLKLSCITAQLSCRLILISTSLFILWLQLQVFLFQSLWVFFSLKSFCVCVKCSCYWVALLSVYSASFFELLFILFYFLLKPDLNESTDRSLTL